MTADKVTLRLNAVVGYQVTDARKAVTVVDDTRQALYREGQLALRAVVGTKKLDTFLTVKDGVAKELEETLRPRAAALGLEVLSAGIRDVILPGDMKDLMNKVTEAKKAADGNLPVPGSSPCRTMPRFDGGKHPTPSVPDGSIVARVRGGREPHVECPPVATLRTIPAWLARR